MKRTGIALLGVAALAGWAVPARAEVAAEDPTVPKDSEAEITFVVPVGEEGGHAKAMRAMDHPQKPGPGGGQAQPSKVYDEEVTIEVPRGVEVLPVTRQRIGSARPSRTRGARPPARPMAVPSRSPG